MEYHNLDQSCIVVNGGLFREEIKDVILKKRGLGGTRPAELSEYNWILPTLTFVYI